MSEKLNRLKNSIRNIPDFPMQGIQFKDITTVLKQPELFSFVVSTIAGNYSEKRITKVVGIESRGFIAGGALAYELGAGFVPVRKPGKLPAPTFSQSYELEYGKNILEIHQDAIVPDDVILLHDDLLATGGTSLAVIELLKQFHVDIIYVNFIIELSFLHGREKFLPDYNIDSLIQF